MSEAKGTYKRDTRYIWQIKHKSQRLYHDNMHSKMFEDGLEGLKRYIKNTDKDNLKWRVIKRTVKEDLINI